MPSILKQISLPLCCSFIFLLSLLQSGSFSSEIPASVAAASSSSHEGVVQTTEISNSSVSSKSAQNILTLEDVINQALKTNRNLVESADAVEGARLQLINTEAEFELKIQPTARAGFSGSSAADASESFGAGIILNKKFKSGTQIKLGPAVQNTEDVFRTDIDTWLNQPLLRGLNKEYNLAGVQSAEFAERTARRNTYITSVRTVIASVTSAYDVVRQRELLRLNEESAMRLKGHAEAARAKEKIGLASQIDAYRADIQKKQAEDNLATVREAYHDALDNLKFLLAMPLDNAIEIEAPLEYDLVTISEQEAIAIGLKNRVELKQSSDTLRDAMRKSRVAQHNTLPELNVVFNYSRFGSGDAFGSSTAFDQDEWGINLVTSTDLARTVEHNAYEQTLLSIRAARRADTVQQDQVKISIKQELRNLRRSETRIAIQRDQITQARGQLELARVKFHYGLANNFDLIEAESELRRAETNLLSVVLDYIIGSYRLRAAMGTLIEKPEGV